MLPTDSCPAFGLHDRISFLVVFAANNHCTAAGRRINSEMEPCRQRITGLRMLLVGQFHHVTQDVIGQAIACELRLLPPAIAQMR